MIETSDQNYTVTGMSCEHCRVAVAREVGALPGVDAVDVDLATGKLAIHGAADEESIRDAVEEAGYELAGR